MSRSQCFNPKEVAVLFEQLQQRGDAVPDYPAAPLSHAPEPGDKKIRKRAVPLPQLLNGRSCAADNAASSGHRLYETPTQVKGTVKYR